MSLYEFLRERPIISSTLFPEKQRRVFSAIMRKGALEVLGVLLSNPRGEFTVREVAKVAGIPTMSCSRLLREFHDLRLVRRRKIGPSYAISLNPESYSTRFLVRLIEACRYE